LRVKMCYNYKVDNGIPVLIHSGTYF